MQNQTEFEEQVALSKGKSISGVSRRNFLGYVGTTSALLALASCKKNDGGGVNLGSGDIGVLNYAYALEQLEAAFYTQVVATPFPTKGNEIYYLTQVRDHEIAHREFFKAALGNNAIQALEVDFSSINFSSRDSVLGTAKAFEDLGVSAYNGAGRLLQSADYLTVAGKIVSVEARHAALIRDLISYNSFADATVVNDLGLDVSRTPREVLAIAGKYIKTHINPNRLPFF